MPVKRRHNRRQLRPQQPRKHDQPVLLFGYIQDSPKWTEWRYRTVTLRKALEMVESKEAEVVTRKTPNGIVVMYRETKASRLSSPTPTTLTLATMEAVGCSDARLEGREWAQVVKFRVWPLIGDTRAVAVRPRISDRERIVAQTLFDRAKGIRPKVEQGQAGRVGDVRTLHFPDVVQPAA